MSICSKILLAAAVAGMLATAPVHAQETVKIGLILPMTGGQASTGKQIDNAVKLYMQQNGDTVAGHAFLDYIDVIHRGDQTLLDKLNDDFPWFPVNGDDDDVEILNRRHVVLVQPGPDVPANLVRPELEGKARHYRCESAMLRLESGLTLEGRIPMDLPEEFSRLSDFLNFPQDFFTVETDEGPVLVSKAPQATQQQPRSEHKS